MWVRGVIGGGGEWVCVRGMGGMYLKGLRGMNFSEGLGFKYR